MLVNSFEWICFNMQRNALLHCCPSEGGGELAPSKTPVSALVTSGVGKMKMAGRTI